MNNDSLTTTCLFRSAFFLCNDCELSEIRFKNGNHTATFMITGTNIDKLDQDYINGKALVNPMQYKEHINRLRDTLTEKITERRFENDRKRNNQKHGPQRLHSIQRH